MKRVWVVYVESGIGHELTNCITESEFYGPFTEKQALKLEADLNKMYKRLDPDNDERLTASAMLLDSRSPREILRECRCEAEVAAEIEDDDI